MPGSRMTYEDRVRIELLWSEGRSVPQIAARLGISTRPVMDDLHALRGTRPVRRLRVVRDEPRRAPEGVVRRMVQASSRPGGACLDFFAGSGTLGAVCRQLDRRFVLVDRNPEAVRVMAERLGMEPLAHSGKRAGSAR